QLVEVGTDRAARARVGERVAAGAVGREDRSAGREVGAAARVAAAGTGTAATGLVAAALLAARVAALPAAGLAALLLLGAAAGRLSAGRLRELLAALPGSAGRADPVGD